MSQDVPQSELPKPAEKHFPCTTQEVDTWISRIDTISNALTDYLNADEKEEEKRLERREEAKKQREREHQQRISQRYDPKFFKRFEDDAFIEKLLKEADEDESRIKVEEIPELTEFERLSLEEAERVKKQGNVAFLDDDMPTACDLYSNAIGMNPVDQKLMVSLRNNRAQVHLRLGHYKECVEDASYVLSTDRHNVKALLRRGAALAALNKPLEAIQDVEKVLLMDHTSSEGKRLKKEITPAIAEHEVYEEYCDEHPADVEALVEQMKKLEGLYTLHANAFKIEKKLDDATGSEKLIMATDDDKAAAQDKLSVVLCEIGALMDCPGAKIAFRLRASTTDLINVLLMYAQGGETVASSNDAEKPNANTPGATILIASAMKVLATALDSEVAMARLLTAGVDTGSTMKQTIANNTAGGVIVVKLREFAARHAVGGNVLATVSALQLLTTLADFDTPLREEIAKMFSAKQLNIWLEAKDARSAQAMRLCDALFKSDAQCKKHSGSVRLAAPVYKGIASPNSQVREAAVGLLLRTSTNEELFNTIININNDNGVAAVEKICNAARSTVKWGNITEPYFVEGLVATLFNTMLKTKDRAPIVKHIQNTKILDGCFVMLKGFAAAPKRHMINVAARCMGLVANCTKTPEGAPMTISHIDTVLGLLKMNVTTFEKQTTARNKAGRSSDIVDMDAPSNGGDTSSTAAARDHQLTEYIDQLQQQATLSIATIAISANGADIMTALSDNTKLILGLVTSKNPQTAGNAALALGAMQPQCAAKVERADGVRVMLDGIKQLRATLHQMDHDGEKGRGKYLIAKNAQKNIAIALSKCCKTPEMMQQLRDQNGIEILYTTLDINPNNGQLQKA